MAYPVDPLDFVAAEAGRLNHDGIPCDCGVVLPARRKFLVTRTETVTVEARTEEEACQIAEDEIYFGSGGTVNIEAEELED